MRWQHAEGAGCQAQALQWSQPHGLGQLEAISGKSRKDFFVLSCSCAKSFETASRVCTSFHQSSDTKLGKIIQMSLEKVRGEGILGDRQLLSILLRMTEECPAEAL